MAGSDALLVDPADHRAVGEALEALIDDPAAADRLRARGRVRAATYSWERTADLVAAAYAEVAP